MTLTLTKHFVKYYNELRSLDSQNRTSAYFKDWCNNQRLRRNNPFSQKVSFNLTVGALKPHHLSQCFDPADDLDGVVFHPELPVYTDGSRDDYYRSCSGIYIKSQDHNLRIQKRNPGGCSVFRSELIAIDDAIGSLPSLPNGKEIWILSDSRSAIQHLSNWQNLEGNEIADTLAKAGACEVPEPSGPLTFFEIFSRTKDQKRTAWIVSLKHHWYQCSRAGGSLAHGFNRQEQTLLARFRSGHLKTMKFSEEFKSFEMCTNSSSEPAHSLECLGLTKQDLADDPLLVLDFLSVRSHGPGPALLTNGVCNNNNSKHFVVVTKNIQ
ncbi:RNase H domain-containing protein [Trichonephila clavipes]|nr:RNase H domain-containing protein [Trichonephila clavipes]